jgi:ABC-type sugar transport system ATPase subunit
MTDATPLLELRNVSKAFGAVQALNGVNLKVPPGKVTALVGDNGAGKSVTIKTISGLWPPSAGEILWEGHSVHVHSPNDAEALGPVASLSGGQRQSVAVAKAVMSAAKLVIMDEPTAALGVAQTRMVLDLIKRLSSQGTAVLVVSHNLPDVFAVAEQISILYLGRMVAEGPASEFDPQVVVDYMTTGQSSRAAAAG